nr:NUDIX domain-containing protein [Rhizobium grahamii]
MPGLSSHKTAEREAWEEAGVIGKVKRKLYGHFRYAKVLDDRCEVEVVVAVHMLKVQRRKKQFPEMAERHVAWMRPAEAANCVREPDLKQRCPFHETRRYPGSFPPPHSTMPTSNVCSRQIVQLFVSGYRGPFSINTPDATVWMSAPRRY